MHTYRLNPVLNHMAMRRVSRTKLHLLMYVCLLTSAASFKHRTCTNSVQAQFQFPDCYLPDMEPSILLSSASFLMSHNAATGYIKKGSLTSSGLTWWYSKNQVGSVYQQLNDGARALDLRPKLLANSTVIFQHGDIDIPVTLEQIVSDAVKWCADNKDELVLLLPTDFAYASDDNDISMASSMSSVYEQFGVPYYHCSKVYGLTVEETMQLAALPTGGYLLVLDGQDYYGSSCAKSNWVEGMLVTCYPKGSPSTSCITSSEPLAALKDYMLASANNAATDDKYTLGPPANLYYHPFNEIQALWQVDGASAQSGISHLSSILDDNRKSKLHESLVGMIYNGDEFNTISLLAVDNVALHGNALLSVLRNQCGQSDLVDCGQDISGPKMTSNLQLKKFWFGVLVTLYLATISWVVFLVCNREDPHPRVLFTAFARCSPDNMCKSPINDLIGPKGSAERREHLLQA